MAASKFQTNATTQAAGKTVLRDVSSGLVLKPMLHSFLFDAVWPEDFSVEFKKGANRRDPDGWFHPSEHPTWPERMLYYLIAHPDKMIPEPLDYMSTLSVTVGTAMHGFIEMCLKSIGVMLTEEELRENGFTPGFGGEPSFVDEITRSRGHGDGIIRAFLATMPDLPLHLFEFKTTNANTLSKIDDLDLDAFIKKWPKYYAQAQEYQRMSGLRNTIVLMLSMGYPWVMKEFHIPYNPTYATDVGNKYKSVLAAQALDILPPPCCSPGSAQAKNCPARSICPVALS